MTRLRRNAARAAIAAGAARVGAVLLAFCGCFALAGCSKGGTVTAAEPTQAEPTQTVDYGPAMVRCLSEKGWNPKLADDGGFISPALADEQLPLYDSDVDQCQDKLGFVETPVTAEQASSFYDKQIALAECLRGLGYDISDPPSHEAYVEVLITQAPPPWAPMHEVFEMTALAGNRDAYVAARAACPPPTTW